MLNHVPKIASFIPKPYNIYIYIYSSHPISTFSRQMQLSPSSIFKSRAASKFSRLSTAQFIINHQLRPQNFTFQIFTICSRIWTVSRYNKYITNLRPSTDKTNCGGQRKPQSRNCVCSCYCLLYEKPQKQKTGIALRCRIGATNLPGMGAQKWITVNHGLSILIMQTARTSLHIQWNCAETAKVFEVSLYTENDFQWFWHRMEG